MESSGSKVGVERVATEQVIEGEATRNVLEKQLIRWAKRGDLTPSVLNVERLQFRNLTPVTVTAFDDGKTGQKIDVNGDGQTTLAHNTKILRAGGVAALLTLNAIYTFTMWEDRVWHESQASGGGGAPPAGVTSFASRTGAVVPVAGDYTPAFIGAVPSSHLTDPDPHTQYVLDIEKGAASGVAQLDVTSLVPKVQLGTGVADITKFLRGDGTWSVAGGGGGSGTYVDFDANVPPTVATTQDDEFSVPGLDVKWIQVNWAPTSYDIDTTYPTVLWIKNNTSNNVNRAILQAIPAGDFTIVTRLSSLANAAAYGYAGLIMTDGTVNGAGNQYILALVHTGAWTWQRYVQKGINFLGMALTLQNEGAWNHDKIYLRIRRVAGVYNTAVSFDGRIWIETANAPVFVPTYFGLFTINNGMTEFQMSFHFFRYFASATATIGARILRTKQ